MIINGSILESAGSVIENYQAGQIIFTEDDMPKYYYQIIEGKIKLNNYNNEGAKSCIIY